MINQSKESIMTAPSLESFFSGGGGGKSVSWKDKPLGATVTGTIKAVNPPQQQTDPKDGSLQFKKNGEPKMSVRIDLATPFRSFEMCKPPDDPNETDDGDRGLFVQGFMQGAIGDALRKAGRQGPPEIGAQLTVKLVERTPNDNPVLSPINKFEAVYVPPSAAATGDFFNNSSAGSPPAAAPPAPVKPATIAQDSWDQMPPAVQAQVAATMGGGQSDQPPF